MIISSAAGAGENLKRLRFTRTPQNLRALQQRRNVCASAES